MPGIIFNAVLSIDSKDLDGLFRVVCTPPGGDIVWLAFIGPRIIKVTKPARGKSLPAVPSLSPVAHATLLALEKKARLKQIDLQPACKLLVPESGLNDNEKAIWERRRAIMTPFLDHALLTQSLMCYRGIGKLVAQAVENHQCSRSTVYRLWGLLCAHGFEASSLNPRFDRCGAPGVLKPIQGNRKKAGAKVLRECLGETVPNPQIGITETDRNLVIQHYRIHAKAGHPDRHIYNKIIESAFVNTYRETAAGPVPVLPPQGTFPNRRQVRHILTSGIARIERVLRKTTLGHYQRNLRGLWGKAHDGIAGPGHMYAIDSTIGDIHLRSSVNRAWLIGRPIVYLVVDLWSTAIVGFYVCLNGPSWATAKVALFSTFCDQFLLGELWGYEPVMALTPAPTAPHGLLSDRGEYLSLGARETESALGINISFDPSYRPDLKGLVEVLNRIAKNEQYTFLPGAIDARRRELELKPNAKESALTLREYVQFLYWTFTNYNLFADRSHRLTSEMIAVGAYPSPAGLWRFGHEMGVGYRKEIPANKLIVNLLPEKTAIVRRNGVFLEQLQYEAPIAFEQEWTAQARNFGTLERIAYQFPGSTSRFWWPDPNGVVHPFMLTPNARATPEISIEEWRDAIMFAKKGNDDREYARLVAAVTNISRTKTLTERAVKLTKEAEENYLGPKLNFREARALESPSFTSSISPAHAPSPADIAEKNVEYESLMDDVFDSMNREAGE